MKNVLIGGIGNVLLGDDGVGPYVVRLLGAQYEFESGVEIADLGTPALDLVDEISGRDAVILIDSVEDDAEPGSVLIYRQEDIIRLNPGARMDTHSPALVDTLLGAQLLGIAPRDLLLVGVRAGSYDAGCRLSEPVKASVNAVIGEILRQLGRLGVTYLRRERVEDSGIWWATPTAEVLF